MANPPLDNYHCFKGMGLEYWRAKACGLQPKDTVSGPQGHRIVYTLDPDDGMAVNNGGIAMAKSELLSGRRALIRFMPASRPAMSGLAGNWWLDLDAYSVLSNYAQNREITLAKAAQTLMVVPPDWSDCGQMIVVRPVGTLMIYRGRGKAVALNNGRDASPDASRQPGTRVFDAPFGTNLEQIFLPGERQFLPNWLHLISSHRADARGWAVPIIPLGL